ncbi:hypothetical protein Dcar01_02373 [Deinococcus carri]|uniref:WW domain-containing protein n=1 Tax=Deinococcus carri TaxID=1211323 RepID=A0ABP9W8F2_9DEIO
MARQRRDDWPEWLDDDVIFAELAERELSDRGELPEPEEVKPLTLREFVHEFWEVLEPGTPLAWGWALDAMCLHLEAAARREIKRLIINVPPGTMKSSLCNVFFPAWVWAEMDAGERFLAVAFNESLSLRDSMAMRRLVESPEYQERYSDQVRLTRDQNSKSQFDTTARGRRLVKSITAATGARANILLIDDPNNATEIHSRAHRRAINNAYDTSLSRRGADPKRYVQICIMQRLHEEDLTGHLIAKGGWEVLRLPEKYEPEHHTRTSIWEDPRTRPGELLFPEFRDEADYEQAALDLGSFGVAGQLQQRPVPVGGGIVKGWWWRYHAPAHLISRLPPIRVPVVAEDGSITEVEALVVPTPETFDLRLSSWDLAFKETKKSDFVVGQDWGSRAADFFLLDQVRGRWDYVRSKAEVQAFAERHPDIPEHLIEDKANGPAIMSDLRSVLPGLIAYEPEGSKESRVAAESSTIEAGNVYLPHPSIAPWVASEYLPEWAQFPNGANDDQIDPTTQALQRFKQKRRAKKPPAAARQRGWNGWTG